MLGAQRSWEGSGGGLALPQESIGLMSGPTRYVQVIRPLLERSGKMMALKSEGGPDADAYKYYQFEGTACGPYVFSVRRLNAGEPLYRGDKLWRYLPRFYDGSELPRQVPGQPAGVMAVPHDQAMRRMKSILRTLVGCFGPAGAGADVGCNSFGRQFQPAFRRTLTRSSPPTWSMTEADFCFRACDCASVKALKMLGPHFLYPINAYPDNPANERWPFYRPVRQLLAQGRRLASRPDVVVQSMGLAGRAFDLPPPMQHAPLASPILDTPEARAAFEAARAAYPGANPLHCYGVG